MEWQIECRGLGLHKPLPTKDVLTFGSSDDCDVRLNSPHADPHFQLSFYDRFIFFSQGDCVRSALDEIEIEWQRLAFKFHKPAGSLECIFSARWSEGELVEIFRGDDYLSVLRGAQALEVQCKSQEAHAHGRELRVVRFALKVLDEFFWRDVHPSDWKSRRRAVGIVWAVWAQMCRYGIITDVIADPDVSEIMANNDKNIFIERGGNIEATTLRFNDEDELLSLIERIAARGGRRIDQSLPYCDTRLADGSRVHAILPPLSIDGPCLTIRKFPHKKITAKSLVDLGSIPDRVLDGLKLLVEQRANILISGGTGSGKTTLLNVLSSFISKNERVITIEDSVELQLQQPHVVRLESRIPNIEGKGEISLRDLLRNALRMRPDRIIVGECRGGEALDMLQAMNTGHDGSMTTTHANSPDDALRRIETLVLFAGVTLPARAIREQIVSAIHYVVQQVRCADGGRRVSSVHKVIGLDEESLRFRTQPLFERVGEEWRGEWLRS